MSQNLGSPPLSHNVTPRRTSPPPFNVWRNLWIPPLWQIHLENNTSILCEIKIHHHTQLVFLQLKKWGVSPTTTITERLNKQEQSGLFSSSLRVVAAGRSTFCCSTFQCSSESKWGNSHLFRIYLYTAKHFQLRSPFHQPHNIPEQHNVIISKLLIFSWIWSLS